VILVKFLAGWRTNFGIWVTLSGVIVTVFVQLFPSILVQNTGNAQIVAEGFISSLVIGFLLCFPFISGEKATEIARKEAENNLPSGTIEISETKLDNWTWYVNGRHMLDEDALPDFFSVYIHAKCGKPIKSK
jgi:hypothetical protein